MTNCSLDLTCKAVLFVNENAIIRFLFHDCFVNRFLYQMYIEWETIEIDVIRSVYRDKITLKIVSLVI